MSPVGLGDGVEFGDLEGEEVEGRDAGVKVKVEDAADEGNKIDDDEEEGVEGAAVAPSFVLLGERRGRLGSYGGGPTTSRPG
ncbi:hypothetical protein D8674_019110 [Pyrus ussuriensis x Pyrus communis]|uniref:Uncharacterized protein n=1 Tax=Pyrus ussuriensis x Pyrus communis TaxID=2448454 RepID=A0A5N5G746_9ROSA|nr:hypothetical protein D8674_019110 [Pyrus ussuriensis x Pyrus communis]